MCYIWYIWIGTAKLFHRLLIIKANYFVQYAKGTHYTVLQFYSLHHRKETDFIFKLSHAYIAINHQKWKWQGKLLYCTLRWRFGQQLFILQCTVSLEPTIQITDVLHPIPHGERPSMKSWFIYETGFEESDKNCAVLTLWSLE